MNALQVISECIHHKHTSLELRECDLRDTDLAWALLAACPQLTELRLWQSTGITSIRILEQLPNLEILHLELLTDVDLSVLQKLPKLRCLHLDLAKVTDLSVLQKMPKLRHLHLNGFNCNTLAILEELPQLELLYLRNIYDKNIEDDFSFFASLVNLYELGIIYEALGNIDFLLPLKKLKKLLLNGNALDDISPISQLENLTYLDISYNHITDFSPLLACKKLTYISAFDNKFTSLPDMSIFEELTFLDLSECRIGDISPLMALPHLKYLRIVENPITVCPPAPIVHFLGQVRAEKLPLKDFFLWREPPQIEQIWQFLATGQADNILLAKQLAIAAKWRKEEISLYTKFADGHLREG